MLKRKKIKKIKKKINNLDIIIMGQGEIPDRRYSPRAVYQLIPLEPEADSKVWMGLIRKSTCAPRYVIGAYICFVNVNYNEVELIWRTTENICSMRFFWLRWG